MRCDHKTWGVNHKTWGVDHKTWGVDHKTWGVDHETWGVDHETWGVDHETWGVCESQDMRCGSQNDEVLCVSCYIYAAGSYLASSLESFSQILVTKHRIYLYGLKWILMSGGWMDCVLLDADDV